MKISPLFSAPAFSSLVLAAAGIGFSTASVNASTILIDLGGAGSQTNTDSLSREWNNITDTVAVQTYNLVDTTGAASGVTITFTSTWDNNPSYNGFQAVNPNGTSSPTGDAAARGYPDKATQDSLYGSNGYDGGTVTLVTAELTGLDPQSIYSFYFFASRMEVSDNRETEYELVGASTSTAYLNVSSNTGNLAQVIGIAPDANGTITLNVQAGPNNDNGNKFFYLGVMEIEAIPEPASLSFLSLGGLFLLRRRRAIA